MAGEQQLSDFARRIRELSDGTPEREQWLAEVARQIREGTYHVEARALADKLLDETGRKALFTDLDETESSS